MKFKDKNLNFLNDLSEPTLGDLLVHYQKLEKSNKNVDFNFTQLINQIEASDEVIKLVKKLYQETLDQVMMDVAYTLRDLSKIPEVKQNTKLLEIIQKISKIRPVTLPPIPQNSALSALCELVDLKLSPDLYLTDIQDEISESIHWLYVGFKVFSRRLFSQPEEGIFREYPSLVPHISKAMIFFKFEQIGNAFDEVLDVFPQGTSFSLCDPYYYKVLTYLKDPTIKLSNIEKCIPDGLNREEMHKQYMAALQNLEEIEKTSWKKDIAWSRLYEYYDSQLDTKIWK